MLQSIFGFEDYRGYLKDVGTELGLEKMSHQLGYRSTRTLSDVLAGRRFPTTALQNKLSSVLDHSDTEREYFGLLIQLEKARKSGASDVLLCRRIEQIREKDSLEYDLFAMQVELDPTQLTQARSYILAFFDGLEKRFGAGRGLSGRTTSRYECIVELSKLTPKK